MEITYIGHSCFKLKGKEITVVIDPYDPKIGYKMPRLDADILLISHDHFDHNNKSAVWNYSLCIDKPGEYEKGGVFVYAYKTFHDEVNGEKRGSNLVFAIDIDGFTILHLGDLGSELDQDTLEKIATVDVLMIPVGGKYTLNAEQASSIISEIEPSIVIPMHYKTNDLTGVDGLDGVEKFMKEMGVESSAKNLEKLKISGRSDIPDETEVYILNPSH